jgi:L-fuconolactonase
MVVDAHTHVFAPVSDRYPRDVHELFPAGHAAPVEALLEAMAAAGVDRAVIVPVSHHDEYVRDALERYPDRFAAIGVAHQGGVGVDGYRGRRETAALRGLRLFSLGAGPAAEAGELDTYPLLAELARLGDALWFYGGREQMELLTLVLPALPELTVVLNHLGYWPGPFEAERGRPRFSAPYGDENLAAVTALARFPNVHVLCTGMYAFAEEPCPYRDLERVTSSLLDAYGPARLLLGSDSPWISAEPGYTETVEALDVHLAGLGTSERALVRGGNAARIFGWEDA